MRVLLIVTDRYSYGGTSRFLEQLLEIHERNGIDTALLVPSHLCDNSLISLAIKHKSKIFSKVNRNRQYTFPLLTPFFDFSFSWETVKSFRPNILVISTADPGRMSVAFYFPAPLLYILHTMPEKSFRLLPRLYMRLGSMLNNLTIAVSRAAARSISINMGIPTDKISVVYNSCHLIQNKSKADSSIVLTVGHLVPYKNPHLWLKVAQQVIKSRFDVKFVWLGDGELLTSLREMVASLSLEELVLLPGHVPDPSQWYERSQIYFQPSLRESHGIAVLEAMAHGLPCVVADTGGLPESVVDNETGFICSPEDATGFTDRILNLFTDASLRLRMGTAGRLRIERCFSEAAQEQKILALYDNLVKKTK